MMNTLLKILALVFATAIPAALAADAFGVSLPALFSASHAFVAFVFALMLLTVTSDYRETKPLAAAAGCTALRRSPLRLAA